VKLNHANSRPPVFGRKSSHCSPDPITSPTSPLPVEISLENRPRLVAGPPAITGAIITNLIAPLLRCLLRIIPHSPLTPPMPSRRQFITPASAARARASLVPCRSAQRINAAPHVTSLKPPSWSPILVLFVGAASKISPTPKSSLKGKPLVNSALRCIAKGITGSCHHRDSEFRRGAREFHHMPIATNPAHVKFCLDAHWVYRGSGNSAVPVFDTIARYGSRVVELHLGNLRRGFGLRYLVQPATSTTPSAF